MVNMLYPFVFLFCSFKKGDYAYYWYHLLRPQSLPHMVQYFCFNIVRVLLPITVNDFKQGNCLCYFNKTYFEATCVVYEKHVQTKYVL